MVTYAPRYKWAVFNPAEQSQIYDPNCNYIKRWLPNLRDVPNDHLHNWSKHHVKYDLHRLGYQLPCLESYEEARDRCLVMYNRARYKSQHKGVNRFDIYHRKLWNLQKIGTQLRDENGRMYIKELMLSPEVCFYSWIRPVSFATSFLERINLDLEEYRLRKAAKVWAQNWPTPIPEATNSWTSVYSDHTYSHPPASAPGNIIGKPSMLPRQPPQQNFHHQQPQHDGTIDSQHISIQKNMIPAFNKGQGKEKSMLQEKEQTQK